MRLPNRRELSTTPQTSAPDEVRIERDLSTSSAPMAVTIAEHQGQNLLPHGSHPLINLFGVFINRTTCSPVNFR